MAENLSNSAPPPEIAPFVMQREIEHFPNCCRARTLSNFAKRWAAKREDHDRFNFAVEFANTNLLRHGSRLPDDLVADWLAKWADDLFIGLIPKHDQLNQEEVAGAVNDVAAVVEALRFVEVRAWIARARRFWLYELAKDPGLGFFPTVKEVQQHCPELNPRHGFESQPGDTALTPRYSQQDFFERASFLLLRPISFQDREWLSRLAVRPDPQSPLWTDPPRHHSWAREQLQGAIPVLSGMLGTSSPQIDDTLPIADLIRGVHNWVVENAWPKLAASKKSDKPPAPEADRSGSRTRAKKSTNRGDGQAKLVGALKLHHQYANKSCLNLEPIGNNELARLAEVDRSTASAFMKKHFGGHDKYRWICVNDSARLSAMICVLSGDAERKGLSYFGRNPHDEGQREDD